MSPKRDHLLAHARTIHGATGKLIADITESESLVCLPGNPNHIRWLTGHILGSVAVRQRIVGGPLTIPGEWDKLFARGGAVPADVAAMPPMAELRDSLTKFWAEEQKAISGLTDDYLSAEADILMGWKAVRFDAALFFLSHEFYHAGQISLIRRSLGRDRMFG